MLNPKTLALTPLMFLLVGVPALAADAGATSDAGVPDAVTADAEAPAVAEAAPAESEATVSSGGGLFEQSIAEASSGSSEPSSVASGLSLSGYLRGDMYVGKVMGEGAADLKTGYGEVALQVRSTKESWGDGFAELRLRYGQQGDIQGTFVDVREAYVNTYVGPVDIRLGKQVVVWGRADLLNPTNNITPNDLRIRSPIEDDRRVGNVGARVNVRLSPVRLEAVWMPTYVPSELPQVFMPQFTSFGTPVYPSANIKNGLVAGRVHLELPSIEMSVSYLRGYAPLPGLMLESLTFDAENPSVKISRTAYEHQVVGLDFSTAIGSLVALRGEAAYRRPTDYKDKIYSARPDVQYALGADRTFGPVMVIVQYLGRYAFDWEKEKGPNMELDPTVLLIDPNTPEGAEEIAAVRGTYTNSINSQLARMSQILFSQTEKVQHLASMRVEWLGMDEKLSLSAIGMVNVSTKEWLAAPKIGYHISDTLMAYVGAEVLTGPRGTLFGLVDQTLSAGYVELRSTF